MTTEPKIKAVAYARFSPRPLQALCKCGNKFKVDATADEKIFTACPVCKSSVIVRNCESCESQIQDIKQYCWKRGFDLVGVFADRALSGSDDCKDRPGLFDAQTACKRGYRLVVRNLDRLFRDMEKSALFRAGLNARGVKILSVEQPEADGDTKFGKLIVAIYDWMDEMKREEIRARTRAKMLQHQKDGRKMSATPPYGQMIDPANPKRLLPCREEQNVIMTIKVQHKKGMKLRQICRWLEGAGITRRGKPNWNHQLVKAILQREGLLA